jgi:hypothetical protein
MSWAFFAGVLLAVGALAYVLYPLVAPRTRRASAIAAPALATRDVTDDEIEEAVRAYRATHHVGGGSCPICGPRPESDPVFCSTCGRRLDVADEGS